MDTPKLSYRENSCIVSFYDLEESRLNIYWQRKVAHTSFGLERVMPKWVWLCRW